MRLARARAGIRSLPWWLPGAVVVLVLGTGSVLVLVRGLSQSPPSRPGWSTIRPPHEVSALCLCRNRVLAGGQDGLFEIDPARPGVPRELWCGKRRFGHVRSLAVQGDTLWVGHDQGLSRQDARGCSTLTTREGLPDDRVHVVYVDRTQSLWIGTSRGASKRTSAGWHTIASADGLAHDMVHVMLHHSDGAMWFGSYAAPQGGISRCTSTGCTTFTVRSGLPHNNVTSLLEDRAGSVWAGVGLFDRGGAAELVEKGGRWTIGRVLTQQDGLAGNKVRSIFEDRVGGLWFGSEMDGIARLEAGRWRRWGLADGLSHPEVKAIAEGPDGTIWLGTRDGITRIAATGVTADRASAPALVSSGASTAEQGP